ncbi:MAG: hypothetical protein ABIG39_05670, partial [Candidatus Micrarchaeota archaeon]
TSIKNITLDEEDLTIGELKTKQFTITGQSNRTGAWEQEDQKHVYLINRGSAYTLAAAGNKSMFPAFDDLLDSFRPIAGFECNDSYYAVNFVIWSEQSNKQYYNLGNYIEDSLSALGKTRDYGLLETSDGFFGEYPAKSYVVSLVEDGFPIKRMVVLTTKNEKLYTAQFNSLRDEYENNLPMFNTMLKGFRVMGVPDACKHRTCVDGTCSIRTLDSCCGNGVCDGNEDCTTCIRDCGVCSSEYPPLDVELSVKPHETVNYSTFNCERYLVRIRISNPLDETMSVFSNDALWLKLEESTSECRIDSHSIDECIATMSGDFGEAYTKGSVTKTLTLYAYGGVEPEDGEIYYSKTLYLNVDYDIYWVGPHCMHFYCIQGNEKIYDKKHYTITGVEQYLGDVLFGNWWCHATHSADGGATSEIYYNEFYDRVCIIEWNKDGRKTRERCSNI